MIMLISIILGSTGSLHAQTAEMPYEGDAFVPAFAKHLRGTKSDRLKDAADRLEAIYASGEFTADMAATLAGPVNSMLKRRMSPATYLGATVDAVDALSTGKASQDRFYEWAEILEGLLEGGRGSADKNVKNWLEFSAGFFADGTIYSSRTRGWVADGEGYKITRDGKKIEVFFPLTELLGYTTGDTILIQRVRGTYNVNDQRWVGTQGRIGWDRTVLDPNKVFVEFRDHMIPFKETSFSIDSVQFTHKDQLDRKLTGRLQDKLIVNNTPQKTTYPRFTAYDRDVSQLELYPNVKYQGTYSLRGSRFTGLGGADERAKLEFFKEDGSLAVKTRSGQFYVDDRDRIHADEAEVVIRFGEDSIYHPNVKLDFDQQWGVLNLARDDRGNTSAPFYSSFHGIEFNPSTLTWPINDTLLVMKPRHAGARPDADFASINLFDKGLYVGVQGAVSYHPLVMMKRYVDQTGRTSFQTLEIVQQFNRSLSIDGAQSLLYELMTQGFIFYDKSTETVHVLDKTENYVLANAERVDFDIIRLHSKPAAGAENATLHMETGDLQVNGVFQVNLSDSQFVKMFPMNKSLTVGQNRFMNFGGTVFGGNSDFYGQDFEFSYDSFAIVMRNIDSMVLFAPTGDVDANGDPVTAAVQTSIAGLTGTLYIDNPYNKSGREDFGVFPYFVSGSNGFAHYQKGSIHKNAYDSTVFYFEVDAFEVDSMETLDPGMMGFSGTLVSGGIFPDIRQEVRVMEDMSLGFETETPPDGYPIYGESGRYKGNIGLSNQGLVASGSIDYQTTSLTGDRIMLFPDSAQGVIDTVRVGIQRGKVEYPDVFNENVDMDWKPGADSLTLRMRTTPFRIYGNETTLEGDITVTSKELRGRGLMDFDEAKARSEDFRFGAQSMRSDSARFTIKSADRDIPAVVVPDASIDVDFETRKGIFRSNDEQASTELPFSKYFTSSNIFTWDMDSNLVSFDTEGRDYSIFQSADARQDSLTMQAERGTYRMNEHVLTLDGVPYVAVGDAHIFPDKGQVIIERDATIQTLENSKVVFDSLLASHELINASVNIYGKYSMKGEGDYVYVNRTGLEQLIHFGEIGSRQVEEDGYKRWETYATGDISDTANFHMDPKVLYKGPVAVSSFSEKVEFDGYAKLKLTDTANFSAGWFKMDGEIEAEDFVIDINDAIDDRGDTVFVGVFQQFGDMRIYPAILNTKQRSKRDSEVMRVQGTVQFEEDEQEFIFGDQDKIDEFSYRGEMMRFNDKTGRIQIDGPMRMGVDYGLCDYRMGAITDHKLSDTVWTFETSMAMKWLIPEDIMERFMVEFYELNLDAEFLDYYDEENSIFLRTLPQLMDEKTEGKAMEFIETLGEFQKVKGYDYDVTFTDLQLIWDDGSESWRTSRQKAGICHIGEQSVNQEVKIYAEFAPRASGDYFNIYLETDLEDWYFISYRKNVMKMVSSVGEFNEMIATLDPKKGTFKHPGTEVFSVFTIGTVADRNRFLAKMGAFDDE